MKKLLLSLVLAVGAIAANAQVWVGGSVGYDFQKDDAIKSHQFDFSPTVGYSLSDKWEIGLQLSFGRTSRHNAEESFLTNPNINEVRTATTGNSSNNYSVQPFVRYNFFKTGSVTFFLDGSIGYEYSKQNTELEQTIVMNNNIEHTTYNQETSTNYVNVGIRPGVKFDVTKHFKLETHLGFIGYSHAMQKTPLRETKTDHIGINASSTTLNVGMIYEF